MSRICQVTGKKPLKGNNVSHSNNKTARRFIPNLHTKKFYLPEEKAFVTLKVSANGIRTINKRGIARVVKELREAGERLVIEKITQ